LAGIKDVARKAGVSIATVSHVINQTKYVSPELKTKVEIAVKELEYEANPVARSMKNKRTKMIGVITADICGMFYPYIMKEIYAVAEAKGYSIIICDTQGVYGAVSAIEREEACFRQLMQMQVDGIIFTSIMPSEREERFMRDVQKMANQNKKIHLLAIERNFCHYGIDSVYFDGEGGARQAVSHLLECGCKKIAHITGPRFMSIAEERVTGYTKTIEAMNGHVDLDLIIDGDYTHQSGYMAMKKLLQRTPDIDGVFSANDQMAVGALLALKEEKIKVPEEVKIIGYDDVFLTSVVEPSLSSIHVRKHHAGRKAAEILIQRMEGELFDEEVIGIEMETRLMARKSSVLNAPEDWILTDW